MIHIKFFASLREKLNCATTTLPYEKGLEVSSVIKTLADRETTWAAAFADSTLIIAINHEIADTKSLLTDGDELAFYPPVTGG